LISTVVMFQTVLRKLLCPSRSLWRRALQDHFSQNNTRTARPRPRPQLARPRPRPVFWSQTGRILRPTVSDHITGRGPLFMLCYFVLFMFRLLFVLVRLSVPVHVTDWKDSSLKWPVCWWGR